MHHYVTLYYLILCLIQYIVSYYMICNYDRTFVLCYMIGDHDNYNDYYTQRVSE